MIQRFYFDTSVFGGVFDTEFAEETLLLFEKVKSGDIICVYSNLTEAELSTAPEKVRKFFDELNPAHIERVLITAEAQQLAETYVKEKVVGETSIDDCLHIATATINKVDILVSWNFKHIVNIYRIRGYNSINLKLGLQNLNIHSPKEIVGYDE
jgi:predicted nucleic acid-binding protein